MRALLPEPKSVLYGEGTTIRFTGLNLAAADLEEAGFDPKEIAEMKLWNYPDIPVRLDEPGPGFLDVRLRDGLPAADERIDRPDLYAKQGFALSVGRDSVTIGFARRDGYVNALSTLKQLLIPQEGGGYALAEADILDWPSIEKRSVSNTFAWYAGYGRIGFDMQLWGYDEWIEYLNLCSDFKINQFRRISGNDAARLQDEGLERGKPQLDRDRLHASEHLGRIPVATVRVRP